MTHLKTGETQPYDGPFWTGSVDEPPTMPPASDWAHAAARGVLACLCADDALYTVLGPIEEPARQVLTDNVATIIRVAFDEAVFNPRTSTQAREVFASSAKRYEANQGQLQVEALDANNGEGWKQYWADMDAACKAP